MDKPKKRFFTSHAKSSAMVVSLALHAILIVVALSFVAVTVIQNADKQFEDPLVTRPKMPVKKLQVPVKMKKKRPKPKIRKQITVKSRMDRKMPDIKMPELVGLKGGMGAGAGTGLGGVAGVGFSMPEIEVFGVKSKGEKVFLILDSRSYIMYDDVGGIKGYTIIKEELSRIIDSLPSTTLFNIAVFDTGKRYVLFKSMVPANQANVDKIGKWLEPLNKVSKGMKADDFGTKTLGPGGHRVTEDYRTGRIQRNGGWYPPVAEAMKQQADTVFLLTSIYGWQRDGGERIPMSKSAERKWEEHYQEALKMLDEENKKRLAEGEGPMVINRNSRWEMNKTFNPDIEFPTHTEEYWYTPTDFRKALGTIRKKYEPSTAQLSSGLKKKKKNSFSLNIIQFIPEKDGGEFQYRYERSIPKYQAMASRLNGQFRTVKGMTGIKRSVSK